MNEINYNKLSVCDKEGRVFEKNRIIYRGIYNKESQILAFLKTDLYKVLLDKALIPKTDVTDLKVEGFYQVLVHETASCLNYPHEWSFEMYKDACLLILNLEEICQSYGYTVKDGHLFNIVFFDGRPKFVDIGSIVKKEVNNHVFIEEFKNRAFLPLLIWSEGHYGLAFVILRESSLHLTKYDLVEIYRGLILIKNLGIKSISNYLNARKNIFPLFDSRSCQELKSAVSLLELKNYKSTWVNYHKSLYEGGKLLSTPRFDKILSIINELNVKSLTDVACNEGVFSLLVSQHCKSVKHITAIDYDENAINNFYKMVKSQHQVHNITMLVNNIIVPTYNHFEELPEYRYKSECVVALAVTHHLLLGQNYHIDIILKKLAMISSKYVIVEFMPLGLWGGEGHQKPELPDYYTENWFLENLKKEFIVLQKHNLETNRVCFVCEKHI